jgi:hypothetical protein
VTDSRLSRPQQSASEALEAHVNGNRMASTFHLVGLDFAQRQAEEIDRLRLLLSETREHSITQAASESAGVSLTSGMESGQAGERPAHFSHDKRQDTPRTDAQHAKWRIHDDPYTGMVNLARQLERELAEANRDVTNLHECLRQAALQEDITPSHGGQRTVYQSHDGFKLLPRDPTDAMLRAIEAYFHKWDDIVGTAEDDQVKSDCWSALQVYFAMYDAAPITESATEERKPADPGGDLMILRMALGNTAACLGDALATFNRVVGEEVFKNSPPIAPPESRSKADG